MPFYDNTRIKAMSLRQEERREGEFYMLVLDESEVLNAASIFLKETRTCHSLYYKAAKPRVSNLTKSVVTRVLLLMAAIKEESKEILTQTYALLLVIINITTFSRHVSNDFVIRDKDVKLKYLMFWHFQHFKTTASPCRHLVFFITRHHPAAVA